MSQIGDVHLALGADVARQACWAEHLPRAPSARALWLGKLRAPLALTLAEQVRDLEKILGFRM